MPRAYSTLVGITIALISVCTWGHDLAADNARFVASLSGAAPGPFVYLGAKHMFTGYDHLLFLIGVIFFLYTPRHIVLYVTLFTIGHSTTLMLGVVFGWQVNAHLVDALIGLSVVYKGFENIGGFSALGICAPDPRLAVLCFGFCHGLGLATRLQAYVPDGDGLLINLLSFNLGVELGQFCALAIILLILLRWRRSPVFTGQSFLANTILMTAGFTVAGYQLAGYAFA